MTGAERVARRRATLRAQGLRPKTFWLPDTSSDSFQAVSKRACQAIDAAWQDDEAARWVEDVLEDVLADYPPPVGLA